MSAKRLEERERERTDFKIYHTHKNQPIMNPGFEIRFVISDVFGALFSSKQNAFALYYLLHVGWSLQKYLHLKRKKEGRKQKKRSHHFDGTYTTLSYNHLFYQDSSHLNRVVPIRRSRQDII